jgi:hypothetical protein
MMTGYVRNATGIWRLWDIESGRIIECSDVRFDEDSTAYSEDSCNEGQDPLGLPPEKPIYEEVQVEQATTQAAPDEVTASTPDEVVAVTKTHEMPVKAMSSASSLRTKKKAVSDPKGTHEQKKAMSDPNRTHEQKAVSDPKGTHQ